MGKTLNFFSKVKVYAFAHKIISVIVLVAVAFGGYGLVKAFSGNTSETQYVVSTVENGTIVSSVSGSGQVSASNEVSVTSKVAGDLVSLNVKSGQQVAAGALLAQVDSRSAALGVENARLALENLTDPNSLSLIQSQNAVENAKQAKENAQNDLADSYTSGLSAVASAFVDFPDVIEGMNDMFYTSSGTLNDTDSASLTSTARRYRDEAGANFDKAKNAYNDNLIKFKSVNSQSSTSSIEQIISDTLATAQQLMESVKDTKSTVDYIKNLGKESTLKNVPTAQGNLNNWLSTVSSNVNSLSSAKSAIQNAKTSITDSDRTLREKLASLADLQKDSSDIDVRTQQLTVTEKQQEYQDYFIRAPFAGVVAKVDVERTDRVSNGTAIATLISKQKVADISLNEVDISKVKVGQKATLSFDAVDGLTISGTVAEVDLVGTVSQGVVSYNVKIAFDTDDEQVLSGMSAAATIATEIKQDVMVVPSSAVKSQGDTYYVELVSSNIEASAQAQPLALLPTEQTIEVGISDDTNTEIISGLQIGDKVVTKTVSVSSAATKTTAATSLFGGGGGGATRALSGGAPQRTTTGR